MYCAQFSGTASAGASAGLGRELYTLRLYYKGKPRYDDKEKDYEILIIKYILGVATEEGDWII